MVEVFREVRRVLRKDGTCWLNLGDSYAGSGRGMNGDGSAGKAGAKQETNAGSNLDFHDKLVESGAIGRYWVAPPPGLKPKDLVGIPWRVAFALQADGWWLRSDIIWSKPNPMPESVTDRPTKAHEYLFLLSKSERYFYDSFAIREGIGEASVIQAADRDDERLARWDAMEKAEQTANGRNKRTVWEIATRPYPEAHFATYPEALVLPCIQAGTSEWGCCSVCGAPWKRVITVEDAEGRLGKGYHDHSDDLGLGQRGVPPASGAPIKRTTGWQATCTHEAIPSRAIVLDPFLGSGTTALVALKAGRDFVGVELNPDYAALAEDRIRAYRGVLL